MADANFTDTSWTPGPWTAHPVDPVDADDYDIRGAGGQMVATVDWSSRPEQDATLIAAAPELYEALKAILEHYNIDMFGSEKEIQLYTNGFNALSKASGDHHDRQER